MAKIVQVLTRASKEYDTDTAQLLVRVIVGVLPVLLVTRRDLIIKFSVAPAVKSVVSEVVTRLVP